MLPRKEKQKGAKGDKEGAGSTEKGGVAKEKVVIDFESPRTTRAKKGKFDFCVSSLYTNRFVSVVPSVDVPAASSSTNVMVPKSSKAMGKTKAVEDFPAHVELAMVRANLEEQRAQVEVRKRIIDKLQERELELMATPA
jgi:hypothetical protein